MEGSSQVMGERVLLRCGQTSTVNCDKEAFQLLGGSSSEEASSKISANCDQVTRTSLVNSDGTIADTTHKKPFRGTGERLNSTTAMHSRQSSDSYCTSSSSSSTYSSEINQQKSKQNGLTNELGSCDQGNIVGLHRKMV